MCAVGVSEMDISTTQSTSTGFSFSIYKPCKLCVVAVTVDIRCTASFHIQRYIEIRI
uniref:Uncharacterized protein n=1 Tax=Anguilla anguilla TaxID=7936 RepID=A0A0E9WET0_ANGAN